MRKIDWRWITATAGWLGLGATFTFGLLGIIGQVHFGKDAPAWVQAIGSIAAILVAITVPYMQRRAESDQVQRSEKLKARSLGAALLMEVKRFRDQLERARDASIRARADEVVEMHPEMIPTALWAHLDRLHELGDAGDELIAALGLYYRARDLIDRGLLMPSEVYPFARLITKSLESCERSIQAIQTML